MGDENLTIITTFQFLGFHTSQSIKVVAFFLLLLSYCLTLSGNLLIIRLVSYSKSLHSPMYFFLSQLSASDILLITDILPNMLHIILEKQTIISFSCCITQFYFFAVAESLECLILTVMSYDRYLAICRPLNYTLIMSHQCCWIIIIMIWTLSFSAVLIHIATISKLQFCGPNIIDYFFCDIDPVLALSCTDISIVQLEATLSSVFFAVIPFFIIIVSYVGIIVTIFKNSSITGRQKTFSTCSSHLTVVCMYYGTLVCVYLVPKGQSYNFTKFLSLLYTVVTPLLNPIIYSLRNKELRKAFENFLKTTKCVSHVFEGKSWGI